MATLRALQLCNHSLGVLTPRAPVLSRTGLFYQAQYKMQDLFQGCVVSGGKSVKPEFGAALDFTAIEQLMNKG